MCNRNCGDNRGGCARTIALMLLGVGLGKKFCDAGVSALLPALAPAKSPVPSPAASNGRR